MLMLHDMSPDQRRALRQIIEEDGGQAIAGVHMDYWGITDEQCISIVARRVAKISGSDEEKLALSESLWLLQQEYLDAWREVLANPAARVRFAFQTLRRSSMEKFDPRDFQHRLDALRSLDAVGGIWVVVPTRARSSCSLCAAWDETIADLVDLRVQYPMIGGTYSLVEGSSQFVRPVDSTNWSCVNELLFQMIDANAAAVARSGSKVFKETRILRQVTHFIPLGLYPAD